MYTVTALALGLGLSVADVGCKRSKESNTPDTLRSSIDPRLNKLGLIIPQQFTAELAPGTIIDGADESVICAPSEVIDDDAVSEASPDGLDDPLKLGAGMLARVKEQAGGVTAVHLDLQGAALKELSGDFKSPKDPACAAKVLKLQDASQVRRAPIGAPGGEGQLVAVSVLLDVENPEDDYPGHWSALVVLDPEGGTYPVVRPQRRGHELQPAYLVDLDGDGIDAIVFRSDDVHSGYTYLAVWDGSAYRNLRLTGSGG